MTGIRKYYLVEASAMPEVLLKVAEATRCLETGRAATVSEAVAMCGLSRSAYYKYRDSIKPFISSGQASMVTFHLVLEDAPGVLSGILREFALNGANILTINQSIPINGVASVTISARTESMSCDVSELMEKAGGLDGVAKIEIIAG